MVTSSASAPIYSPAKRDRRHRAARDRRSCLSRVPRGSWARARVYVYIYKPVPRGQINISANIPAGFLNGWPCVAAVACSRIFICGGAALENKSQRNKLDCFGAPRNTGMCEKRVYNIKCEKPTLNENQK